MATKSLCYFKDTRRIATVQETSHVWSNYEDGTTETPNNGYMAVVDLDVTAQNETDLANGGIFVNNATTPTSIATS